MTKYIHHIFIFIGLLSLLFVGYWSYEGNNNVSMRRNLDVSGTKTLKRPVMHTFYQRTTLTGMTDVDDRHLLEAWREGWHAAGWDTKILTLDDAKKHDKFESYEKTLTENTFDTYNELCYVRWLAMAANGGGWMCDYDVFPIPTSSELNREGRDLPYKGKLTVYEYTRDGGVPSLVSGTAEEWERVALLLIDKSFDKSIASDMYALIDLHHSDPENFVLANKVLKGHFAMKEKEVRESMCRAWGDFMAIHISHYAVSVGKESGRLHKDMQPRHRPKIASEWMSEWINVCGKKKDASNKVRKKRGRQG